jgi:uncharacterized protein YceK
MKIFLILLILLLTTSCSSVNLIGKKEKFPNVIEEMPIIKKL